MTYLLLATALLTLVTQSHLLPPPVVTISAELALTNETITADLDALLLAGEELDLLGNITLVSAPCQFQFECISTAGCIPLSRRCDGIQHCSDGSDEARCQPDTCAGDKIGEKLFACTDVCIETSRVCDGTWDCYFGEDERECGCANATRGALFWCDGAADCADGRDEADCGETPVLCGAGLRSCNGTCIDSALPCGCGDDFAACADGSCVLKDKLCDFKSDCADGSDEFECGLARKVNCSSTNGGCSQLCVANATAGDRCACHVGYKLQLDRVTCNDADECRDAWVCSQTCVNTPGSYHCRCVDGYRTAPGDSSSCVANGVKPWLIFTNGTSIEANLEKLVHKTLVSNMSKVAALAMNYPSQILYWVDNLQKAIYSARLNETPYPLRTVVNEDIGSVRGMAYDWLHGLLYWTDSQRQTVEVLDIQSNRRKVLVSTDVNKPRGIVVNPEKGLLYWADWGSATTTARLEVADMDGKNAHQFISTDLQQPTALYLDLSSNQLIWTDTLKGVIERINLDGTGRSFALHQTLQQPYGLAKFEDTLVWSQVSALNIQEMDYRNTSAVPTSVVESLKYPESLLYWHNYSQPAGVNRCKDNSCSHICLPTQGGHSCVCETGYFLKADSKTCAANISQFLLITHPSKIVIISLDTIDRVEVTVKGAKVLQAYASDYNPNNEMLYWTDASEGVVKAVPITADSDSPLVKIIAAGVKQVAGIAVDWLTNNIYWVSSGSQTVEMTDASRSYKTVVLWRDLVLPKDIAVAPELGLLFWTDWDVRQPFIGAAGLDGSDPRHIVNTASNPTGLTVFGRRIYWMLENEARIESAAFDGTDQRIELSLATTNRVVALAVSVTDFMWSQAQADTDATGVPVETSRYGGSLLSTRRADNHTETLIRRNLDRQLQTLRYFDLNNYAAAVIKNPCDNARCEYLCLRAPSFTGYQCACPIGLQLAQDHFTCRRDLDDLLLIAHQHEIVKVSLASDYRVALPLPVASAGNILGLATDPTRKSALWSDVESGLIQESAAFLDTSEVRTIIGETDAVMALAYDYASRNLYFVETLRNRIAVVNVDTRQTRTLVQTKIHRPRSIAVHLKSGYLFWAESDVSGRIGKVSMDGFNPISLVESNDIGLPITLAVDDESLFWVDEKRNTIESCDHNGNQRIQHAGSPELLSPFGLALTPDFILFTDSQRRAALYLSRDAGEPHPTVLVSDTSNLQSVAALGYPENGVEGCATSCSHICLRNPAGHRCLCPDGFQMNGNRCQLLPAAHLLAVSSNTVAHYIFDTKMNVATTMTPVITTTDSILDSALFTEQHRLLYAVTTGSGVCELREMDYAVGNKQRVIASTSPRGNTSRIFGTIDSMFIDRDLANLYWTTETAIQAMNLTSLHVVTLFKDSATQRSFLTGHLARGFLFWISRKSSVTIERCRMDGTDRRVILSSDFGWPNGLSVDAVADRLYWADTFGNYISSADLDGRNRKQVVTNAKQPFSAVLLHDNLIWRRYNSNIIRISDGAGLRQTTLLQPKFAAKKLSVADGTANKPPSYPVDCSACREMCLRRGKNEPGSCRCRDGRYGTCERDFVPRKECKGDACTPNTRGDINVIFVCVAVAVALIICLSLLWCCRSRSRKSHTGLKTSVIVKYDNDPGDPEATLKLLSSDSAMGSSMSAPSTPRLSSHTRREVRRSNTTVCFQANNTVTTYVKRPDSIV